MRYLLHRNEKCRKYDIKKEILSDDISFTTIAVSYNPDIQIMCPLWYSKTNYSVCKYSHITSIEPKMCIDLCFSSVLYEFLFTLQLYSESAVNSAIQHVRRLPGKHEIDAGTVMLAIFYEFLTSSLLVLAVLNVAVDKASKLKHVSPFILGLSVVVGNLAT